MSKDDGGKPGAKAEVEAEAKAKAKAPLQEMLRGAWAAAHGLAHDAEQEAKRLSDRLGEIAGVPRAEAERLTGEIRTRFTDNRAQLERRLEEEVRAYLSRLRFPSRQDLAAMNSHLDGLEARVGALERRRR